MLLAHSLLVSHSYKLWALYSHVVFSGLSNATTKSCRDYEGCYFSGFVMLGFIVHVILYSIN